MDESKLNDPCERAAELCTRQLVDELTPDESTELDAHLQACPACRNAQAEFASVDAMLVESLGAPVVATDVGCRPGFAQRVMSALPAEKAVTVYLPKSPVRRWPRIALSAAACVAIVAVLALVLKDFVPESNLGVNWATVRKGKVLKSDSGAYTVQETAVVELKDKSLVKFEGGAKFQLKSGREQEVTLEAGDLFAYKPSSDQLLRVACCGFTSEFEAGQFFVAEENAVDPRSILIVFEGHANVTANNEEVPLKAGQAFISVGKDAMALTDMIEIDAAPKLDWEKYRSTPATRMEYQKQVSGYRHELDRLSHELADSKDDAVKTAELRERFDRVTAYLAEHERKLKAMIRAEPMEHIQRARELRTDPSKWL